ncbi:MAG: hypothetical protein IPM38_16095 [Ignavibacteria bacterium]|nr:hypothetical protein [Ignavibacteria bacterium]
MNFYNENCFGQEFTRCASHSVDISGINTLIELKIKLGIEGLYNPVSDVSSRKDTVTVYLRNADSPYQIIDSSKSIIDSISHPGILSFTIARPGFIIYLLKIKKFLRPGVKSEVQY